MKNRFLIILVFTILLITSLMISSQWGSIQKEIWFITGEYNDPDLVPSINYDYSMMYVVVLVTFGIIGAIIFGINFIIWRKRK